MERECGEIVKQGRFFWTHKMEEHHLEETNDWCEQAKKELVIRNCEVHGRFNHVFHRHEYTNWWRAEMVTKLKLCPCRGCFYKGLHARIILQSVLAALLSKSRL